MAFRGVGGNWPAQPARCACVACVMRIMTSAPGSYSPIRAGQRLWPAGQYPPTPDAILSTSAVLITTTSAEPSAIHRLQLHGDATATANHARYMNRQCRPPLLNRCSASGWHRGRSASGRTRYGMPGTGPYPQLSPPPGAMTVPPYPSDHVPTIPYPSKAVRICLHPCLCCFMRPCATPQRRMRCPRCSPTRGVSSI